jgi:predicted phosphodiesterase
MALPSAMATIHMNLLHLSDMHFGPRHWLGNNKKLLEKINSYDVDIVLNTGDSTTDALQNEFEEAGLFLQGIDCTNVISIPGNHDKRNMRSADYFRQYIDDVEVIRPLNRDNCRKHHLYLDSHTTDISNHFTDINFVKKITVNSEAILLVCLDSNELYKDTGL